MVSLTIVIGNVTDSWPFGIVTVAGTVAAPVSLLASVTTRSPTVPRVLVTVAVSGASPSVAVAEGQTSWSVLASAVVKFHVVAAVIPGLGRPSTVPVTLMLSIAHHQSFEPVLDQRKTIVPSSGFGTDTVRSSLTLAAVAVPDVLLLSSVRRFVQVAPAS